MEFKKGLKYYLIITLIVAFLVFLDQLSKFLISHYMFLGQGIEIIPKFFFIEYIHNEGAAWGMFQGNLFVILIMPAVGLLLFGYLLHRSNYKTNILYVIGVILMIAGTIGNYIDRIRLGYVVDFLSFRFGSYHFPNFNIADSLLVIGVILFAVDILFISDKKEEEIIEDDL